MVKPFVIPLMGGLALSLVAPCEPPDGGDPSDTPSLPGIPTPSPTPAPACPEGEDCDPACAPLNAPIRDSASWEYGDDPHDTAQCPPFERSCCPEGTPGPGADPLAGAWEARGGTVGGEFGGCGGAIFRAAAPRVTPQTCGGGATATMSLGEDLQGCMEVYSDTTSSSYFPTIGAYCARYDVSVAARSLGRAQYAIRLLTTETTLDLACTLEGEQLRCQDADGGDWDFTRP